MALVAAEHQQCYQSARTCSVAWCCNTITWSSVHTFDKLEMSAMGITLTMWDAGMNHCMKPVFADEAEARALRPRVGPVVAE